ncbi:DNA-binding transcriptional ArsR family regulator [Actinoplanes octamycinicus]|uniref:DNA-binding transcriptional ArsR family regulator n=1 Tax=Actinoplanes octamycinicus TaxID=135948 RepID=A0A7W7H253_9ACTN|nr:winged helix-turn-helix domain-containing protein [Actinoplanes octamycinicus]MBB4742297.1 DNA-binding transcriptional ArsR family regulator [Actinoplanes octamycinicus]GIE59858.1 transcriptional regulator [Actinoplanes octamycinicus]
MIEWEFRAADLAGLRFAHSPMAEVVASVFALREGSDAWMRASWRSRVVPRLPSWPTVRGVLLGPHGYAPDFLTPAPRTGRPTLAEEFAEIAATPLDRVAEQVASAWAGRDAPPEVDRFARDPRAGLTVLLAEIRSYFAVAIEPWWLRLRTAAEAEIATRARAAAEHGARTLVDELHPRLDWNGSALLLRYPHKHGRWGATGHGLTLLPTGFAGSQVYAMPDSPSGRTLWYAPRGFGNLWTEDPQPAAASPLTALLGPTRAAVLTLLAAPYSTGDVAARLGLAAGTASHHLTTLRDAGLASAERTGRRLLYQRTPLGDQLAARPGG